MLWAGSRRTTLLGPNHEAPDGLYPCPVPHTLQPGMLRGTGTSVSAPGTHLGTAGTDPVKPLGTGTKQLMLERLEKLHRAGRAREVPAEGSALMRQRVGGSQACVQAPGTWGNEGAGVSARDSQALLLSSLFGGITNGHQYPRGDGRSEALGPLGTVAPSQPREGAPLEDTSLLPAVASCLHPVVAPTKPLDLQVIPGDSLLPGCTSINPSGAGGPVLARRVGRRRRVKSAKPQLTGLGWV